MQRRRTGGRKKVEEGEEQVEKVKEVEKGVEEIGRGRGGGRESRGVGGRGFVGVGGEEGSVWGGGGDGESQREKVEEEE